MTLLAIALLFIALHLANRAHRQNDDQRFRQHAEREAIRQSMHLSAWETGELVPEAREDALLGRRIAMGLSAKRSLKRGELVEFKRGGR